jgi:hypothetical protein
MRVVVEVVIEGEGELIKACYIYKSDGCDMEESTPAERHDHLQVAQVAYE